MDEKKYVKNGIVKTANAISVSINGKRYTAPNEAVAQSLGYASLDAMLASCGWDVYNPEEEGAALEQAIAQKVAEIEAYDSSDEVNVIYVNGEKQWIAKADRVGLKNLLNIQKEQGQDYATIWLDNRAYTLVPITKAIEMLDSLELYAWDCYNVTQSHIANVKQSTSVAEVTAFDVSEGYPNPLRVSLS